MLRTQAGHSQARKRGGFLILALSTPGHRAADEPMAGHGPAPSQKQVTHAVEKRYTYAHTNRQSIECIYHIERSWDKGGRGVQSEALVGSADTQLFTIQSFGAHFFGCCHWIYACRHRPLQQEEYSQMVYDPTGPSCFTLSV